MRSFCLIILLVLLQNLSFANTMDLPLHYTARENGMMGAGSAYTTGSATAITNPAGLAGINQMQFEATFHNTFTNKVAPASGDNTKDTAFSYVPVYVVGGGYRLTDMISLGAFSYVSCGAGGGFEDINYNITGLPAKDQKGSVYFIEFGPSIALKLPYNLKFGFSYRFSYVKQTSDIYNLAQAPIYTYNSISLSGMGYTGFKVGLQYNPIKPLHIGIYYRNPVTVKTSGKTNIEVIGVSGTTELETTSQSMYADKIGFGIAYEILKDTLMAAIDYELAFYSKYKNLSISTPQGTTIIPQYSSDFNAIRIGAEYTLLPELRLRGGLAILGPVYNKWFHRATTGLAPGPAYLIGLGAGYSFLENWRADMGYAYFYNHGTVPTPAATPYATSGYYRAIGHSLSFQISFSM